MLTEQQAAEGIEDLAEELGAPCWHDLCEKDDRTSPEDYPDHAIITRAELIEYIKVALDMAMDPKAAAVHRNAVAAERERCAATAESAALPEGFQWGREAMGHFEFGKKRCAEAIRALQPVT